MTELSKPMSRREGIHQQMFERADSTIVAVVRIVTGIAIFLWACSYTKMVPYDSQWLPVYDPVFLKPRILFKYAGFEWVQLWPGNGIYWHFLITKVAAVFLVIGFLSRLSAAILCASIAYVMLVERQIYLNHYYLLACVAGLLVFLPAGRRWSIDSVIGIEPRRTTIANWQLWLLRFQLGMPYVFGAIAKLDSDWFAGAPGRILLESRSDLWLVDAYLKMPGAVVAFAVGGFLYDLLVVPMLLWHRTRMVAVLMSIVFHVTNSQLFVIGIFPWFMLATLIVFFPPDTAPRLFRWISSKYTDEPLTYDEA
ncbi:MAG: HTTM domain-containing protein, partial [Pirellulaceae bacterium]|nr:HTTM domain-containing protein [Pirellulaceae bacterium]